MLKFRDEGILLNVKEVEFSVRNLTSLASMIILSYLRYIKNLLMTKPKKNVISIVGTTGVGKSQVSDICENLTLFGALILTFIVQH